MHWDRDFGGADWLWMSLSMTVWLLLLGAVVYVAIRLATRDRG